jgi:hypothetical protein
MTTLNIWHVEINVLNILTNKTEWKRIASNLTYEEAQKIYDRACPVLGRIVTDSEGIA